MMARQSNAAYWAQRLKNMEDALLDQSYTYVENMEQQFAAAQAEVEKEIAAWYQRFAVNNEISFADAKRLLTKDELAEFQWSVGEYIAYGQQNALDGAWVKQLENASAKVHISRLEALKLQIQQQAEVLYSNQLDFVDAAARRIYEGSYYGTAFEIQRGFGVGWTMQAINESTITKVLSRPWTVDGQTFRDRCWTNKESLVNSVNTQLTQMIIRGEAPDQAIAAISKQFNVSKSKAGRLIMTESAYFSSAAQKDCYGELGVERYKIVASFDQDTCELCGALDGKVFKMSEYQVGLTAPPFHPWCRCCTAPYFEDMDGIGERWTRNGDGTTQKVPANTTFEDWKKQFVEPVAPLSTGGGSATMTSSQQHFADVVQKLPDTPQGYTEALEQRFSSGTDLGQEAFTKCVVPGSVENGSSAKGAYFDPRTGKVTMNFSKEAVDPRGIGTTFFHEHGHYIDFHSAGGGGYTSVLMPDFGAALLNDYNAYIKATMKQYGIKKTEAYTVISQELRGATHNAVSDLFGGLSANKCVGDYGHWNKKYWKLPGAIEKEAFAHMFEAQFSSEKYTLMQRYFPSALAEFEKLLKGVL